MRNKIIFVIVCALVLLLAIARYGIPEVMANEAHSEGLAMNSSVPVITKAFEPRVSWVKPTMIVAQRELATQQIPSILPINHTVSYSAGNIDGWTLMSMANATRTERGVNQLAHNQALSAAAYLKAQDMLAKQYWSHYGPNGESPWQFMSQAGYYVGNYAGENLAEGYKTSIEVHNDWLNSPSHLANIVDPNFRSIGIAVIQGNFLGGSSVLVVQMFGVR